MSSGCLLEFQAEINGRTCDVDLSVAKKLEVLNSDLLFRYCCICPTFRQACIAVKKWYRRVNLNADKKEVLNSFSLYLLVLGFMLHKNYLPNLLSIGEKYPVVQHVQVLNKRKQ